MYLAGSNEFANDGRNTSRTVIRLAEIFARRLDVRQQWDVMAHALPIFRLQRHSRMTGNGYEMRHAVRRPSDGRVYDNGILKRVARQNLIRS